MLLSFLLAVGIFFQFLGVFGATAQATANGASENLATGPAFQGFTIHLYDWATFGNLHYPIDFRVDTLTAIMLIVVTGVSTAGADLLDRLHGRRPWLLALLRRLSLFTVSMLGLVLGANLWCSSSFGSWWASRLTC